MCVLLDNTCHRTIPQTRHNMSYNVTSTNQTRILPYIRLYCCGHNVCVLQQGQVDRARISKLPPALEGGLIRNAGVADRAARARQEARAVKRITKKAEVRIVLTCIMVLEP